MMQEIPPFWWRKPGWQAWLLWPVSLLVGRIAARRLVSRQKAHIDLPVLCVAALAIGAGGRTEIAMALAAHARRMGHRPGLIAAGPSATPRKVDVDHDIPRHLGDEALQLARAAPTVLSSDRLAAARALAAEGVNFLIIADGQASDRLVADLTLLVVDAERGIGNGHVVPAGPVRAPLLAQFSEVDAVLKLGEGDGADRLVRLAARAGRPVYEARIEPQPQAGIGKHRLLAFTGIAAPDQFFELVRRAGGEIEIARAFADGHLYSDDEAKELFASAAASQLQIVTSARDAARLRHVCGDLEGLTVLETDVGFELAHIPQSIVDHTVEGWRHRQGG